MLANEQFSVTLARGSLIRGSLGLRDISAVREEFPRMPLWPAIPNP